MAPELLGETVRAFSNINIVVKALAGFSIGLLLIFCACASAEKKRFAFTVGAVGELIYPLFGAVSILAPSSATSTMSVFLVPIGILLTCVMMAAVALDRESTPSLKALAWISFAFLLLSAGANGVSGFFSFSLVYGAPPSFGLTTGQILAISGISVLFLTIITSILCAVCFGLMYTTEAEEAKE